MEALDGQCDLEGSKFSMYDEEDNDSGKPVKYVNTQDYWADLILDRYRGMQTAAMTPVKIGLVAAGPATILLFALFVTSSASTLVAFSAMICSLMFIGFSVWLLGWILDKDIGPRSMQEIAETIKEGSEGFFKTQYGTIFKLAFVCSIGLFFIYSVREPVQGSDLNNYFSTMSMAMITSASFLIGACCSAMAGYAGIWVSVRANLRVAAASRNDYNAAL